ncbi:unnamed protein product [Durusdinium trenchii]|uniref:Uncharacterized protein n=2 Tax=Durusdinium trenchii TaxID=1381693 RepID=A0ABP0HVA6_9DINO
MPLELPDDDLGPVISTEPLPTQKPHQKSRKGKRSRSSKRKIEPSTSVADNLPSDDDGPPMTVPGYEPTDCFSGALLQYDDERLKLAAQKIPSQVHHPFDDLRELLSDLKPPKGPRCTLWEVFSLPRLQPVITKLGGRCTRSYDLRNFFDLGEAAMQRTLFQDIAMLQPLAIFLSPPCTWVCALQHSNWGRMAKSKRVLNLVQALMLIDLAMWIAEHQVSSGNYFGFEHPAGSLAWNRASVTFVQRHSSVRIAEFDQCQFGLESVQTKTPIKKRTKVMTNSDELMKALHGQFCPGTHTHQIISGSEGGLKRSTAAQVYPDRLCITICKALIAQEAKHPR